MTMTEPQTDDSTPPRKRIAVACGRCRKRKIRCSGDPGQGRPCTNCKNAGVDSCLFLRVSSQEAPLRDERFGFEYNVNVARTLAQRGQSASHMNSSVAQYPQDMHLVNSGVVPASYRSNAAYPSMGKGFYSVPADWTDTYNPMEYNLNCQSYPVMSNESVQLVSGYGPWPPRVKAGSQNVYVDAESGYSYNGATTTNLVHRPAVSGDSAYSFSSVAASLPASAGNERLLPNPAGSRALGNSVGASAAYRGLQTDGLSGYSSTKSGHSSISGAGQGSPTSPVSGIAAAAAAYANTTYDYSGRAASHHGGSDVYGPGSETIFGDSDRNAASHGSAVDLTGYTYGPSSDASSSGSIRHASSVSGLTSRSVDSGSQGYAGSDDSGPSHHGHQVLSSAHRTSHRHHSTSHGGHHHSQHPGPASVSVVGGGTASSGYAGETSGSGVSGSGVGVGVGVGVGIGGTATADSHRASVSPRR